MPDHTADPRSAKAASSGMPCRNHAIATTASWGGSSRSQNIRVLTATIAMKCPSGKRIGNNIAAQHDPRAPEAVFQAHPKHIPVRCGTKRGESPVAVSPVEAALFKRRCLPHQGERRHRLRVGRIQAPTILSPSLSQV